MSLEMEKKNGEAISRMAARREVRRLRKNKKKVPAELMARAWLVLDDKEVARKRKVAVTVQSKSRPVVVKANRQQAARELGIKNRRWMNAADLQDAIDCANEIKRNGPDATAAGIRLAKLEVAGRDRCRAAWDAWKAKQKATK